MKRHGPSIPRGHRRNPAPKIPVLPLVLVAGGAYLLLRSRQATPVEGLEGWGSAVSSVRGAISSAAGAVRRVVRQVAAPVKTAAGQVMSVAQAVPQTMVATLPISALNALPPVTPFAAAAMLASTVMSQRGQEEEAAELPPETQYQDENGNTITEAEYNRRVAEQQAAEKAAAEEAARPKEPIYQDANGKQISKADYDQLLALLQSQPRAGSDRTPLPEPTTTTTSTGVVVKKLPPLPPSRMNDTITGPTGPVPQPQVLYFDANGKPITGIQFSQQMNALPAGSNPERRSTATGWAYKVPAAAPAAPVVSTPAVTGQANAVAYQPSGAAQSSNYELPPAYTPPTAQAAPQSAPAGEAAAAPAKVNPALTVGALLAVPLVFMMSGGK